MSKTPTQYAKMLIKELYKHANRDNCKQILRAMGLNPDKEGKVLEE